MRHLVAILSFVSRPEIVLVLRLKTHGGAQDFYITEAEKKLSFIKICPRNTVEMKKYVI